MWPTVVLYRHCMLILTHRRHNFLVILEGHWRIFFNFGIRPLFLWDIGTSSIWSSCEVGLWLERCFNSVPIRVNRVDWLDIWVDLILAVWHHHLVRALLLLWLVVWERFELLDRLWLDLRDVDVRALGLLSLPLLFHYNSHSGRLGICLGVFGDVLWSWIFVVLLVMWRWLKDLLHMLIRI